MILSTKRNLIQTGNFVLLPQQVAGDESSRTRCSAALEFSPKITNMEESKNAMAPLLNDKEEDG
jgi:hypothetical protein